MEDFDRIYSTYFTDVYKYIYTLCKDQHLAEEITQETFFKALKNINKFDGSSKLYVWLCQIAKNTYFSYYKREKKKEFKGQEGDNVSYDGLVSNLVKSERAYEIHKALHKMKEPYKEVFTLRIFGELDFKQIAELFGKTESWARVTFYRAKNKIKELCDED